MARRLPPLNALRSFEASARLGSFVAAAGELRVSPAAVSQQVRRLERYLDTTLFQRMARGLVLTEQGRDYLPELSAGFDLLGESTARLRAKRADGVLTLTTLAGFANGWLLPRLHRFRERAPRIDVVLRTSRRVMDFRRDAIDLAIRFAPGPGRGLHGELLSHEELFPVASPQLFRGGRMPDTLAALAEYPLLHDTDAGPDQPAEARPQPHREDRRRREAQVLGEPAGVAERRLQPLGAGDVGERIGRAQVPQVDLTNLAPPAPPAG